MVDKAWHSPALPTLPELLSVTTTDPAFPLGLPILIILQGWENSHEENPPRPSYLGPDGFY